MPGRATINRILTYFVRHPDACCDAEGLTRWQLIEEDVRDRLEETQLVLDRLVGRGLVERLTREGTAPLYRLNMDRQGEAQALTDERSASRAPRSTRPRRR